MEEISMQWISTTVIVVVVFAIMASTMFNSGRKSSMKWPDGPKTLPIIGNMHQLGGTALQVLLHKLADVYGSVMTIWIGSWRPVIVVSDIDKAWEVLVNKSSDYSARDMPEITRINTANWRTISTSDSGPHWSNLRKGLQNVALSPLNVAAQSQFQERDIEQLIKNLQEEAALNNGIVKPLDHLKKATVRLLSRMIYGQNFNDDEYVEAMHNEIEELIRISGYARLAEAFYYAKYLPSHKKVEKAVEEAHHRVKALIRPFLTRNPPPNSYLHFLHSQNYSEEVIIFCIYEVYLLGVDSTSSTTAWALAFLIREPAVQEKLYQELNNFIGGRQQMVGSAVKVEDVNKLQYLQAVMKETMRMKPIAPLAIPHKACKDTSLGGNRVDKGTRVMVNLHAIHHNLKVWHEPYKFIPERFLLQQKTKEMEQSFLPFSAGMRICAGMELGKLQFGFALANLVNAFQWSCVSDGKLPDMSDLLGFVLFMKTPLEARIVPRIR
ncbi:Cytochrome P450 [Macleaya cordata]|uniref:Cytochrome P450 n=1 Tax=Macleaya cordata TaxID=56857 RepID=A0A200QTC5_MACCD|nr:Cytochrome P450 [Macleaya cordata]